jgi:hypothetical protein
VETVGVEPTSSSLQARRSPLSYVPERVRTDGVEPPQREAPRLQRGELTLAQRPPEGNEGGRPGSNRRRRGSQPRVLPLHHGHHEAGTTGLEPAASRLTSECSARLSYAPKVRGWDSNPRSRAHEAREDNRSSTAQSGWQESNLRSPAPEAGGVACSPTARSEHRAPPVGLEPAASALRARRHRRFDHRGIDCRAR